MEIPENIRPFLKQYCVFLLENHGALSAGKDVFQAYYRMESLELFAKISFIARTLGNVNVLRRKMQKKLLRSGNISGCRGRIIPDAGSTAKS